MTDLQIPDYYALAQPCNMAAALAFTALQLLRGAPTAAATAAEDQLRLALALLAPGAEDVIPMAPRPDRRPLPQLAPATAVLARPAYRAAALVFSALQALGEYPADAPDYDATAVEHLRLALAVLAPGFGNLQILGAPRPVKPPPLPFAAEDAPAPAAGPAWVKELLAEPEPEPPVGEHLWRMGEGVCARCGARARFAMGGQCSWRPEEPSTGTPAASEEPSTTAPAAPADLCEARSWTLFTASANELLYGSGLKAILEARAEDDPGFQVALACLQRREHQAAALALRPALAAWTPATTVQVREHGVLTLAGWLLGLRQFRGSELWPEKPSITARPEAARQCACPRRDARDCIVERSRPRGQYPAQIVDTDEVCECFCHRECEGDECQDTDCADPSCPWKAPRPRRAPRAETRAETPPRAELPLLTGPCPFGSPRGVPGPPILFHWSALEPQRSLAWNMRCGSDGCVVCDPYRSEAPSKRQRGHHAYELGLGALRVLRDPQCRHDPTDMPRPTDTTDKPRLLLAAASEDA